MQVKVDCAATTIMVRALASNRADHVLALQHANKQRQKRAAKGKQPARESAEAKDEKIVQRMSSEVNWKTAKVHQDWAKRICPIPSR